MVSELCNILRLNTSKQHRSPFYTQTQKPLLGIGGRKSSLCLRHKFLFSFFLSTSIYRVLYFSQLIPNLEKSYLMPKYYYHWSSPNTQTIEEARTHKLLSYIYVDQVTNVPCSFFPQSAVDDNGYVPLVDAKDRLHHKHDPKTPPRMCLRLRGGHREVLNSTQNSGRSQLYWYIQAQFFMGF